MATLPTYGSASICRVWRIRSLLGFGRSTRISQNFTPLLVSWWISRFSPSHFWTGKFRWMELVFLIRDLIIIITLISVTRRSIVHTSVDYIPNIATSFPLSSVGYFPGKSSWKEKLENPQPVHVHVQSFCSFVTTWKRSMIKLYFLKFYLNERLFLIFKFLIIRLKYDRFNPFTWMVICNETK